MEDVGKIWDQFYLASFRGDFFRQETSSCLTKRVFFIPLLAFGIIMGEDRAAVHALPFHVISLLKFIILCSC